MTASGKNADRPMRAAVLTAPGQVEVRELAAPWPESTQVRVRLEGCGVCGSNLPVWQGRPWLEYPRDAGAPGHEGWGVVDALGAGVDRKLLGARVALLSYKAFAEYDVADARQIVPLPPALDGQPFPGEALGCALNVFRRAGVTRGDTVAVIGAGFLGLVLVQLIARSGARAIAISRRRFALELAERAGALCTLPFGDPRETIERVQGLTGGRGCEVVIEVVGEQAPLDLAAELCAERGRLVIAGYHQDRRQVNMQLWNWRGLDVVNAHERAPEQYVRGMRAAVRAVIGGAIDPSPLYTHRFALHELGSALAGLGDRPDGMLKTWVAP